jgi:hypothetical protein
MMKKLLMSIGVLALSASVIAGGDDRDRGPGMWIMNLETIKSEQFRHAFKIWWDNWKIEKNKYSDIREWWDLAKNKIQLLTMEISRNLKHTWTSINIFSF